MEITPIIKQDFLKFDTDEVLSEMIGKLRKYEKRSGLVFKNKKYLGLVEKKRLLRSRLDTNKTKVGKYVHRTTILNEDADVLETAYMMFQSNVDFLPVERNKEIIGVLQGLDVANLAMELPETKSLKLTDLKLTKSIKVNKDDPLASVLDIMYKQSVDQVPVFDKGKLYGIISYRDILRKYLNWSPKRQNSQKFNKMVSTKSAEVEMPNLANLPVEDFSTNDNLLTINQNSKLREAVKLMFKNNVSSLLVMKENEFNGMLTVKNLLGKIGSLRVAQNFDIKFVGLKSTNLGELELENIKRVANNEAFKLQRLVNNEFVLTLHLKEYEKDGAKHKYSVAMRIEFPGQIIASTQEDWNVVTALRKTFNNAKSKLEKKFKV